MADASYMRYSFLGGERSKSAQGRADLPDYPTGMNVCLNGFPLETGAWTRRPGFRHLGPTRGGGAGRLIPFDFKQLFPYTIEFTDAFLRFWSGPNLVMADGVAVTSISTANPAVVLTATPHGAVTGATYMFPRDAPALLQNRQFLITRIDNTHFSIRDAITGATIDGSALGSLGASPTTRPVYEIASPYTAGSWASVRSVQAETTTVLLNGASPRALAVVAAPTSSSFATFALTELGNQAVLQGLKDGPYLDANGSTLLIQNHLTGQVTINTGSYPDARQAGFVAGDVGRAIRMRLGPARWNSSTNYTNAQKVSFQNGNDVTYWIASTTSTTASQPGTDTSWLPLAASIATQWAPGVITAVVGSGTVGTSISTTFGVYFANGNIIYEWQLGVYSDAVGWPTCGCYHEGRLWLGGAIDNRIDGSKSNDIFNFAPSDLTGAVADDNAIAAVFNAKDVNAIFWMRSNSLGILCGTQAGEWLVQATAQNLPLTPTTIQAHRVTRIGCANMEPAETGNTIVFVQRYGRSLMEYFPDVFSGRLTAPNLAQFAKHLTVNNLSEITYQQELTPVVWMRDGSGLLKGVSYKRENLNSSAGPTFAGWHRHTMGSGRTIESVCTGASSGGNLDALFVVTNDAASGIRHVEMLTDLFEEGADLADAWFLDDAVTPSSTTTTDTASTGFEYGSMTLNGLWHLNGKSVQITADGLDLGQLAPNATTFTDYVVANGSVTIPYGDGLSQGPGCGLFDATFAATANIVVGFTYTSDGQPVKQMTAQESGARNGPAFGKKRRHHQYALQTVSAAAMSIGTKFTKLNPILFKDDANIIMPVGETYTGTYQDTVTDDYSYDSMLCWRSTRPLPATIVAIGGFLHTADR